MPDRAAAPRILVFDSGLGGLTVFAELRRALAGASFVYAADDAVFPYGRLPDHVLIDRVVTVIGRLVDRHAPDLIVVACNTASTLVLPALRQRFAVPVVGTVPAIKPAAAMTRSGHVAVLATPGTVARDYTRSLVETYAGGVAVTLVGAAGLAALAEARLRGEAVDDAAVLAEIGPCFAEDAGRRVDVVALACTHYPLLLETLQRVSPWPVTWIDPAPAIAPRCVEVLGAVPFAPSREEGLFVSTGAGALPDALVRRLGALGLPRLATETVAQAAS